MSQKKELQVFAIKSGVSSIRIFNFKNGTIEFSRAVLLLKELYLFCFRILSFIRAEGLIPRRSASGYVDYD
mgnify:CR=1 FL=1